MFIGSHITIVLYLSKQLRRKGETLFRLKSIPFIFGNLKPDITRPMAASCHYFDSTQDFIGTALEIISDDRHSDEMRSISLGVLCHFLTDYTCTYHARIPYRNQSLLKHLAYEMHLHYILLKELRTPKSLTEKIRRLPKNGSTSPGVLIRTCIHDYMNAETSMENDILFALYSTQILTSSLLSETKKEAAASLPIMA